jgi:hypothetical protein
MALERKSSLACNVCKVSLRPALAMGSLSGAAPRLAAGRGRFFSATTQDVAGLPLALGIGAGQPRHFCLIPLTHPESVPAIAGEFSSS